MRLFVNLIEFWQISYFSNKCLLNNCNLTNSYKAILFTWCAWIEDLHKDSLSECDYWWEELMGDTKAGISKTALIVEAQLTSIWLACSWVDKICGVYLFTFTWIVNYVSGSIEGIIHTLNMSINLNLLCCQ